ncbi:MAG: biopolymer transporter ExbD [Verrucomicrobiota bacterium]
MARLVSPRPHSRPRLEIIPFIDIMFFLLATYMMVSLSMIQNQGMDVQLPGAKSISSQEPKSDIATISVLENGEIYWNKELVVKESLLLHLQELKQVSPDSKLIIQGDKAAPYGKVVEVLDLARGVGLTKLHMRTEKK